MRLWSPIISGQNFWIFFEHGVRLGHDGGDDQGLVMQTLHQVGVRLGVVPGEVGTGAHVPDTNPENQF